MPVPLIVTACFGALGLFWLAGSAFVTWQDARLTASVVLVARAIVSDETERSAVSDGPKRIDAEWYKRMEQSAVRGDLDVCNYCPHVRALHDAAGCKSPTASLFAQREHACDCTNAPTGSLYGRPSSLRDPETPT